MLHLACSSARYGSDERWSRGSHRLSQTLQHRIALNGPACVASASRRCEFCAVIRFPISRNETAASVRRKLVETYGNEVMSRQRVDGAGRSEKGRPTFAYWRMKRATVHCVRRNRDENRQPQRAFSWHLSKSSGRNRDRNVGIVAFRRSRTSRTLPERTRCLGDPIATGDETWDVSLQRRRTTSPTSKKFKTSSLAFATSWPRSSGAGRESCWRNSCLKMRQRILWSPREIAEKH